MRTTRQTSFIAVCSMVLPMWGCFRPQIESEELFRLHAGFGDERINKSVKTPFSSAIHIGLKLKDQQLILALLEGEELSSDTAQSIAREIRNRMDGFVHGLRDRSLAGASAKWDGFPQMDPAVELQDQWREGYAFGWWLHEVQLRNPK